MNLWGWSVRVCASLYAQVHFRFSLSLHLAFFCYRCCCSSICLFFTCAFARVEHTPSMVSLISCHAFPEFCHPSSLIWLFGRMSEHTRNANVTERISYFFLSPTMPSTPRSTCSGRGMGRIYRCAFMVYQLFIWIEWAWSEISYIRVFSSERTKRECTLFYSLWKICIKM